MKPSFRIFLLIVVIVAAAVSATAQTTKWTRYVAEDGKFSALLPTGAVIDAKKSDSGEFFWVYGFVPAVEITLTARKRPEFLFIRPVPGQPEQPQSTENEEFVVSKWENKTGGRYQTVIGILGKKILYNLRVEGPAANHPDVMRALLGLRIHGKPLVSQKDPETDAAGEVVLSKLVTSPEIEEARKRKIVDMKGRISYEAATNGNVAPPKPNYTRRAIIVEQPPPMPDPGSSYLALRNATQVRGVNVSNVTVRVTLRADGQVGDIVFIGTPLADFAKRVRQAARKIRFVPAQLDGRNVDSEEFIDYSLIGADYR